MKYLYNILLLCTIACCSFAQKRIPAIIVEKNDGTKDTISLTNANMMGIYGKDNPKDGDYCSMTLSGTSVNGDYVNVALKYKQEVTLNPAEITNYGCILTRFPVTEETREAVINEHPIFTNNDVSNLGGYMLYIDSNDSRENCAVYITSVITNYQGSANLLLRDAITGRYASSMPLPADGTEYYAFAFVKYGEKIYFSNISKIRAVITTETQGKLLNYSYYDNMGDRAYAFNYDFDKHSADLLKLGDNAQKTADVYLSNLSVDETLFQQNANMTKECTNGRLYCVDDLPAQTEQEMFSAIRNMKKNPFVKSLDSSSDFINLKEYLNSKEIIGVDPASVQNPVDRKFKNPILFNTVKYDAFGKYLDDLETPHTLLLPNDYAWLKAKNSMLPGYQFATGFKWLYIDKSTTASSSLQTSFSSLYSPEQINIDVEQYTDSIVGLQITRPLFFDNAEANNGDLVGSSVAAGDVLQSVTRKTLSNVNEIVAAAGPVNKVDGGYTRVLKDYPFLSWETYEPVINIKPTNSNVCRALNMRKVLNVSQKPTVYEVDKNTLLVERDTLFTGTPTAPWGGISDASKSFDYAGEYRYKCPDFIKKLMLQDSEQNITYLSTDQANLASSTANPELDFRLTNTLSTKYHIFVVIMPKQLQSPEEPVYTTGQYLRFDLAYNDADGTPRWYRLNVPNAASSTASILLKSDYINVVELEFEFPMSYYGLRQKIDGNMVNVAPTLMITNDPAKAKWNTSANRKKFDQELRIGGIFMIPESAMDYYKSLKF